VQHFRAQRLVLASRATPTTVVRDSGGCPSRSARRVLRRLRSTGQRRNRPGDQGVVDLRRNGAGRRDRRRRRRRRTPVGRHWAPRAGRPGVPARRTLRSSALGGDRGTAGSRAS
jgi:hypothetical protein